MAAATPITSFPWQPDSTATAERAIQTLRQGLMRTLKGKRGIHTGKWRIHTGEDDPKPVTRLRQ